ncbi:hypothetical protein [Mycolicibacterium litorale]|uniref:ATP/GTP-binding protein n=1 Tax=Mycolicibacterium litorale TaxID=758802 RepID=A0AAD1IGG6_9MYCO|nr:hypothetical protein [Mycolicibacterium litorale]MCV7414084.1 hypothetical protein [Mycolicibacterium litorale]TDY03033.1 hypothetical protein BCL50_4097 [Mycolicibacterium litorale]BBY14825.1 hypothetical protein MLIT_04170 [Mycolicibacterium litorale]
MPRRRPPPRRSRPLPPVFSERRVEAGPDGYDYEVRPVAGSRATKTYRCPGCDHEIRPGTAHLVVWPADAGEAAVDDRRHWHTPCWTHRATRGPTRRWS